MHQIVLYGRRQTNQASTSVPYGVRYQHSDELVTVAKMMRIVVRQQVTTFTDHQRAIFEGAGRHCFERQVEEFPSQCTPVDTLFAGEPDPKIATQFSIYGYRLYTGRDFPAPQ
jgi:hypothetical protein